jgi:hypothetical protein
MSNEEEQEHVIDLVNQINAVLAGESGAAAQTALTIAVACQVVVDSPNADVKRREDYARGFANQLAEFIQREDVVGWIKHNISWLPEEHAHGRKRSRS